MRVAWHSARFRFQTRMIPPARVSAAIRIWMDAVPSSRQARCICTATHTRHIHYFLEQLCTDIYRRRTRGTPNVVGFTEAGRETRLRRGIEEHAGRWIPAP